MGWLIGSFGPLNLSEAEGIRFLASLPLHGHPLKLHDSCAVVGSSNDLSGRALGSEIDQHSLVVRINCAPTAGFEKDYGSKTDLRISSVGGATHCAMPETDFMHRLGVTEDVELLLKDSKLHGKKLSIFSSFFLTYLQSNFFDDLTASTHISTGILAVLWALHSCQRVDTYGFTAGSSVERSAHQKYFIKESAKHFPSKRDVQDSSRRKNPEHDWVAEYQLHERLERAGALRRRHK